MLRIAALAAALAVVGSLPAAGQGWWPWSNSTPPTPREPVYRPPPGPGPGPGSGAPSGSFGAQGNRPPICLQLEQRLAQEVNRGSSGREVLPKIEADMRQVEQQVQRGTDMLERNQCYEYFLFAKSLRRTRQCVDLDAQVEGAKRRLSELSSQRQQLTRSDNRSYRDDIIRELAYNNCGSTYSQEARRSTNNPFSSLWQDEDSGGYGGNTFGGLPFATYRTICVRLCDGYYFPVSFSTLPTYFDRDADLCQSKCAAPAELYYHQNPGGSVEQAVSHKSKQTYTTLRTAFRYRKEFVSGCSCKQAEYLPQGTPAADKRAEGPGGGQAR